jgi:hypothetical protein
VIKGGDYAEDTSQEKHSFVATATIKHEFYAIVFRSVSKHTVRPCHAGNLPMFAGLETARHFAQRRPGAAKE